MGSDEMPLDTAPPPSAAYARLDLEVAMDRYIHRENMAHYRRLLAEVSVTDDSVRHKWLLKLLADEEAKDKLAERMIDPPL
jgi:hypothetical protein